MSTDRTRPTSGVSSRLPANTSEMVAREGGANEPRCPYCASTNIAAIVKKAMSDYRRCDGCGQIWHPDRLPTYRRSAAYR